MLASIVSLALFWLWASLFGTITLIGSPTPAGLVFISYAVLGLFALLRLWQRSSVGALACIAFYSLQLVSFEFASGGKFDFSGPTILYRLNSDASRPVNLNVIALVLLILSLIVWRRLRDAELSAAPSAAT